MRETRKQRGHIEIKASAKKDKVLVSVSDNGIGIPENEIGKLFKKFSRASNAVKMYTDGSGLGLFIVKEIVTGHWGKIWVKSQEGKGTVFFVELPQKKV